MFGRRRQNTFDFTGHLCLHLHWIPHRCFRSLKDKETPEVDNNDRSTITTSQLAIHLINTRLGALTLAPRLSKLKVVALGHPPLALAAPLLTASFGRTPLSYRMLFSTTIGV